MPSKPPNPVPPRAKAAYRSSLAMVKLPAPARGELRAYLEDLQAAGVHALPPEARTCVPARGDPFTAGHVLRYAVAIAREDLKRKQGT